MVDTAVHNVEVTVSFRKPCAVDVLIDDGPGVGHAARAVSQQEPALVFTNRVLLFDHPSSMAAAVRQVGPVGGTGASPVQGATLQRTKSRLRS